MPAFGGDDDRDAPARGGLEIDPIDADAAAPDDPERRRSIDCGGVDRRQSACDDADRVWQASRDRIGVLGAHLDELAVRGQAPANAVIHGADGEDHGADPASAL